MYSKVVLKNTTTVRATTHICRWCDGDRYDPGVHGAGRAALSSAVAQGLGDDCHMRSSSIALAITSLRESCSSSGKNNTHKSGVIAAIIKIHGNESRHIL